ncbi:hypothetical protein FHP25_15625 [Vineibacter terrae]|uniref:Tetratricopeptide repeat protein n=1 Tax=Vineibacter terrae TaxID=2586908 RepID=A0A5C8PMI6_9HYPH|nr:hypothetical protein [Vineibacter terrae]TXL74840.1 hypothetical protein FHP25_15625 [Vineibacter terrae]
MTEPAEKPHPVLERYYALDPERRRPARLIVALIAVLAGVLLLLLAVPRLFAAIELLDARSTAERAEVDGAKLTAAQLESTAGALQHALEWQDDADLAALLAAVRLVQATRADPPERATERLMQASDAAKRAVRLSPAHPTAWTLLAMAQQDLDPRQPLFHDALQRAIAVAPYDPRYRLQRVEMACRYWHQIDAPTRQLASAEIRILAARDLNALAALAKRSYGLQAVRDALANDAALLERFDAVYIALP